MELLLIGEGDAESPGGSWSGSSRSLLRSLRARGHRVRTADVELYGWRRMQQAALTTSPSRARWRAKFHLGAAPFRARSTLARRALARGGAGLDAILQIGATFQPPGRGSVPYYLYCDSNILLARHGAATGQSEAAALSPAQLEGVIARERAVYENASGIFTLSDRLRRSFIEDFEQPPSRVHTVRAGPNFDTEELTRLARREPRSRQTILFVGVEFARKGGDTLLSAFRTVQARHPQARLVIIGPRSMEIDEPGVTNLGFLRKEDPAERARLLQAYQDAAVFCLPTRFEPFGIVFLEAMCAGLPCVGSDAWAVPEMIQDGVTGFTFPVDDADALAERLIYLLENPDIATRMGEAGQARALNTFTWSQVVDRMLAVIDQP